MNTKIDAALVVVGVAMLALAVVGTAATLIQSATGPATDKLGVVVPTASTTR